MKNTNGKENSISNSAVNFDGKEIEFPVTFQLKAVMLGSENDDDNKEKLTGVFKKHNIPYSYHDKKTSSKGAYVSFTYNVTIADRAQIDALYNDLKKIKEIKFAV